MPESFAGNGACEDGFGFSLFSMNTLSNSASIAAASPSSQIFTNSITLRRGEEKMVVGGEKKEKKDIPNQSRQDGEREKEKHLQRNYDGVDLLSKNNNSNKGERGGEKNNKNKK